MKRQDIDELLEAKMLTRAELARAAVVDCGEPMIALRESENLRVRQIDPAMRAMMGSTVMVRVGVAERLAAAASLLGRRREGACLEVVYGYRSLEIQTAHFEEQRRLLETEYSGDALLEATHRRVAAPDVAGHPTGGAVDITIVDGSGSWDMGTPIWSFTADSYVFSPFISRGAWQNRQMLRDIMLDNEFAPFDGEWWHFSYGDREWAQFHGESQANYAQLVLSDAVGRSVPGAVAASP